MGDAFQKKNALRYGLPRLGQASTKFGLFGLFAGTLAALFGADPAVADFIGGTAAQVIGAAVAGAGVHAAIVDDGSA